MPDPHQINLLIATAISECRSRSAEPVSTEEDKIIAKCVVQQLADAGFQILHVSSEKNSSPGISSVKNRSAVLIGDLIDKLRVG